MNKIAPIVDFEDKSHNPFVLDEAAYGDMEDIYTPLSKLQAQASGHKGGLLQLLGVPEDSNLSDIPMYTVLGYDEVMAVDNDAEAFSIDVYKHGLGQTFGNTLSLFNPPEHTALRRVFQKAFLPHIVGKWGDQLVTPVVNGLIDKFIDRGEADLVEEFAVKYPFQ